MVKFSFRDRYDDGEGSRNPTPKRRRVVDEEEEEVGEEVDEEEYEIEEEETADTQQEAQRSFEMELPHIGAQESRHSNSGNEATAAQSCGNSARSNGTERGKNVPAIISDPEALECYICCEPLTIPVFQCENGHIACSGCCKKIRNKCPMCLMPIGYFRCRGMEKLLESIKISCPNEKYGCKEMFSYNLKSLHEKECSFLPCVCPHPDCDFVASSKELALHFSHRHVGSGFQLTYDKFVSVYFNTDTKAVVLKDEKDVRLFIVHNIPVSLGNAIIVSCVGPKSMTGFHYDILARSQGTTLILQSTTRIIQENTNHAPTAGFLLIPGDYFGSGQFKLDIRVKSPVTRRTYSED